MSPVFVATITTPWGEASLYKSAYINGDRPAFVLYQKSEPLANISVNMEDEDYVDLGPNEFFAKTYAENEPLRPFALDSGYFEDTGKRLRSGYIDLEVWRFLG